VSLRFQADNDLNRLFVTATLRAEPSIDFQTAQAAQLDKIEDPVVLLYCASQRRILITHDKRTMPGHFQQFVSAGHHSPGLFLVIPQWARVASVVECLVFLFAYGLTVSAYPRDKLLQTAD
jgi:Domain of unknown function (DUF5615)